MGLFPVTPAVPVPVPANWTIFGHSYWQMAFGTRTQQGRADGYFRNLMSAMQGINVANHAIAGSRCALMGDSGFGRVLQVVHGWTGGAGNLGNTAPYTVGGAGGTQGAFLLGWGMNDVGLNGDTTQCNLAYQHAMRTVISRCRMSTLGSTGGNCYPGGTGTWAVSGFAYTPNAGAQTGTQQAYCLSAGSFITITLPSDYNGETVALCFIGAAGATTQNLITFSGTSGASGTIQTENLIPLAAATKIPYTVRFRNFTAGQAGTTIIATVTTMGGSNSVTFDSWWLEADNPPPVIVTNTARLCGNPTGGTSGYATYQQTITTSLTGTAVSSTPAVNTVTSTWGLPTSGSGTIPSAGGTVTLSWAGTTPTTLTGCTTTGGSGNYSSNSLAFAGPTDTDVENFNPYLTALVANEFDGMVQIADIDTALNRSPQLFAFDGVHANELGASKIAYAIYQAVQRLIPDTGYGPTATFQPPYPVITPLSRPYLSSTWYTSDSYGGANGTAYTPVIGDMWALPLFITTGVANLNQWSVEELTASVAPTVLFSIYDDRQMAGYPQWQFAAPAGTTALSLLAAPGVFTSTLTGGNNGYLNQAFDGGLYWLVLKIVTTGTCTLRTCKGPSLWVPNLTTSGGGGITPCGWYLSGQGTGAFSGRFPTGAVQSDNVPMIGVKTIFAQ
jgi:hypothetical protein